MVQLTKEKQLFKQIQPAGYPAPTKLIPRQIFKEPAILKLIQRQTYFKPPPPPKALRLPDFEKKRKLKKKIKKKIFPEYAYVPGFTARAIGLKALEVSEKQAQQLIKKVITGFEVRRPIRIVKKRKKKK